MGRAWGRSGRGWFKEDADSNDVPLDGPVLGVGDRAVLGVGDGEVPGMSSSESDSSSLS